MFNWDEFLNVARAAISGSPECFQRTAISRAYYSAFHFARKFLIDTKHCVIGNDKESHEKVRTELMRVARVENNPNYFSAGTNLQRLRISRNLADYDDSIVLNFKNTQIAIHLASQIRSDCR